MRKIALDSFAKVNLYLAVLNKRPDNYHNIHTLFERINLSDKIILKSRPDNLIKIQSDCPDIPLDSSNLAYKAAKLLQSSLCLNKGVDIKIIKRIPVGSGMGGGSSNAAVVLQGLNRLWGLGLSQKQLVNFGKKLGADVPFFLYNTAFAEGTGRGDQIKPLRFLKKVKLYHLLIVPRIKVSTPLIYRKYDEIRAPIKKNNVKNKLVRGLTISESSVKILSSAIRKNNRSLIKKCIFNGLEEVTFALYPRIKEIKEKLVKKGFEAVLMSGSGSTVFVLLPAKKEAIILSREFKKNLFWQVFVARTC